MVAVLLPEAFVAFRVTVYVPAVGNTTATELLLLDDGEPEGKVQSQEVGELVEASANEIA